MLEETARVGVIKDFLKVQLQDFNQYEKTHLQIRSYHYLDISNVLGFFLISHSWPGLVFVLSCSALGWAVGLSGASARRNSKYHHSSILIISCCTGLVGQWASIPPLLPFSCVSSPRGKVFVSWLQEQLTLSRSHSSTHSPQLCLPLPGRHTLATMGTVTSRL